MNGGWGREGNFPTRASPRRERGRPPAPPTRSVPLQARILRRHSWRKGGQVSRAPGCLSMHLGCPRSRARQPWALADTPAPGWVVLFEKEEPRLGGGGQDPSPENDLKLPRGSSPLPHFPRDLRLRMGFRPDQRRLPSPLGGVYPTPFLPQPRELTPQPAVRPWSPDRREGGDGGGLWTWWGGGWRGLWVARGLRTVQVAVAVLTVSLIVGVDVERCPPRIQNP